MIEIHHFAGCVGSDYDAKENQTSRQINFDIGLSGRK